MHGMVHVHASPVCKMNLKRTCLLSAQPPSTFQKTLHSLRPCPPVLNVMCLFLGSACLASAGRRLARACIGPVHREPLLSIIIGFDPVILIVIAPLGSMMMTLLSVNSMIFFRQLFHPVLQAPVS